MAQAPAIWITPTAHQWRNSGTGEDMTFLAGWPDLPDAERIARTRCLRLAVRLIAAGSAHQLEDMLARAEAEPGLLPVAAAMLDELPTIPMRRILALFAATLPTGAP